MLQHLRSLFHRRPDERRVESPSAEQLQIAENLAYCRQDGLWNDYFVAAEPHMESQWNELIWPLIRDADFSCVVEIGPGAGRNSARLAGVAGQLHLVDVNGYALDQCRARFADHQGPCEFHFHLNDGLGLGMLGDDTMTFVYSWDTMVHFDRLVLRSYLGEFARVMRPGAIGFCHHSNAGGELATNPHARSNMTAGLFRQYCAEAGLECTSQTIIPWAEAIDLDCISSYRKP